ncbi:MAG: serine hydrolase domain-containing protein [Terriglobia bacterium]
MMQDSWKARSVLAALLTFALSGLAFTDTRTDKVDKLFAEWDKTDSPGCALGVIQNGKLIYQRGYGMANLEHNIPIIAKSVFRIGSTSKQFAAMSILLLAEQGKLSLGDDIRNYLPEMPDYESPITIRHLIHHTSGLRDYLTLMSLAGKSDADYYRDEDLVRLLARQKALNFQPGEKFLYSNSGYFLLSQIVQRASGKSLRAYAEEHIFKPLGMNHTHFHDDYRMIVKNRAAGYAPVKEDGYRIDMTTLEMVGDGGVFTTVEDLFLWDQNFYQNRLGSGRLLAQMLTPGTLNNGEKLDYAFGLRVSEYQGLQMVSHGGAFVGFRAELIRFPKQTFSVICLCNLSRTNPSRLARQVADIYLGDQFKATGEGATEKVEFIELPERELKEKAGAYRDPASGNIVKLSVEEGKLTAAGFGLRLPLAPVSKTEFRAVGGPVEIAFRFEPQGPDRPLRLHVQVEDGKPTRYEGVELVSPTAAELQDYAGEYYSEELDVTYRLAVEDGKLFFRHRNAPENALEPTLADEFQVRGWRVNFLRTREGRVSGFTVNAGRVRNIRFARKAG